MTLRLDAMPAHNMAHRQRWAALAAGGGLLFYGLQQGRGSGWTLAALGGGIMLAGATGYNPFLADHHSRAHNHRGIHLEREVSVRRLTHDVWEFWRDLENLPRLMPELVSVKQHQGNRTHWIMQAIGGKTLEWDAEIITEEAPWRIGWRTLPGAFVEHTGSVYFEPVGTDSTRVRVELQYNPPLGYLGAGLAQLLHNPGAALDHALARFKKFTEKDDKVNVSSEESFPASDAPSWTPEKL